MFLKKWWLIPLSILIMAVVSFLVFKISVKIPPDGTKTTVTTTRTTQTTTSATVVRTTAYVIAASDAPANIKAQADYVCHSSTGEDTPQLQAAIAANRNIQFSEGNFYFTELTGDDNLNLKGSGAGTIVHEIIAPNSNISSNVNAGQNQINVVDANGFTKGMVVLVSDTAHFEQATIQNVKENTVTLTDNLTYSYTTANRGRLCRLYNWFTSTSKTSIVISDMTIKTDLTYVSDTVNHVAVAQGFALVFQKCTNCKVQNVYFTMLPSLCTYWSSSADCTVSDCVATIIGDGCFDTKSSQRISILDNKINTWGCAAILAVSSDYINISNNTLYNGNDGICKGIALDGSRYCVINGNVINKLNHNGIYVQKNNGANSTIYNVISNNNITNVGAEPFDTSSDGAINIAGETTQYNLITGNTIVGSCNGILARLSTSNNNISDNILDSNSRGIFLMTANYNTIDHNTVTNNGYEGIILITCSNNQLTNNYCFNNNTGGDGDGVGLLISTDSNTNFVQGNRFEMGNTQLLAIQIKNKNCDNNVVVNNYVTNGGKNGGILDSGTGTDMSPNY